MCGIAALFDPAATAPESIAGAIAQSLRHRGPDGSADWRDGPATLIHTRLAIIDVQGGDQPFISADGQTAAIVNGEIYNHRDLRAELEQRGHAFTSHSDCEVVLHGYREWGIDVLRRLNGMFGIALWDGERRQLVIARDALGVKPVYWWSDGRRVAAASEIKAILATRWTQAALDPIAVDDLITWRFVPAPRTIFAGISKLAPGTVMTVRDGDVSIEGFRAPPADPLAIPVDELEREIADRFSAAVTRQTMADVPYGAFLSGGLDSAAIVAAMASDRAASAPRTFTIGFPGHGAELDERAGAQSTATALGARHSATTMEMGDFLDELGASVRSVEEPCGTASAPAAMQLSRYTAQSVKVVLSGQGADEPWGGYQRHQAAALLGVIGRVPRLAHRPLAAMAELLPRNERAKRAARLLGHGPGLEALLSIFEITSREIQDDLLGAGRENGREARLARAQALADEVGDRPTLDVALHLDTHLFLPDQLLVWGDKTSMASSLEQRVPFLDQELLAFVERIPARDRMRRAKRKWLYRRSMARLVPPDVLDRRKHPFATPYDQWLQSSLGEVVRTRYAADGPLAQTVSPTAVSRLVDEHQSGRFDHKRILYCLLELSQWHQEFVEDGATST